MSVPQAIVKTVVWMLGDLGYNETFIDEQLDYPYLVNCLFLVFLFTIGAFIITLLKSPSTDKNKVTFYRMARKVQMFFHFDICFPKFRKSYAVGRLNGGDNNIWILSKLDQILERRQHQPGTSVMQTLLSNIDKLTLFDMRDYRSAREKHWMVEKMEKTIHYFTPENETEEVHDFPNVIQDKINDQTKKLDQLLSLYNQLHDSYQKQNEQIIELKNQLDNIKIHTL